MLHHGHHGHRDQPRKDAFHRQLVYMIVVPKMMRKKVGDRACAPRGSFPVYSWAGVYTSGAGCWVCSLGRLHGYDYYDCMQHR